MISCSKVILGLDNSDTIIFPIPDEVRSGLSEGCHEVFHCRLVDHSHSLETSSLLSASSGGC